MEIIDAVPGSSKFKRDVDLVLQRCQLGGPYRSDFVSDSAVGRYK